MLKFSKSHKKILFLVNAKAGFEKEKTGIEVYTQNLVKYFIEFFKKNPKYDVIFFIQKGKAQKIKENILIKPINLKIFWSLIGLSYEILKILIINFFTKKYKEIILFCPAHNFPLVLPPKRIITIHGLEYEYAPFAYSLLQRLYLKYTTKFSCFFATRIIAVSKTTKKDLVKLYKVPSNKIKVIYHGFDKLYRKN